MSLSKQATDKPTNPNATHAAIKWNDFAAKEFEEHYKSRTRHRNHIPQQRYQQQSQQQQRPSVLYLPPLPPSPKPLSPTNSSPSIPSTTPPIQKQQLPSQQQKPTNDSVQSWQNFALEASKTTPNNNNNNMNNDNGITTTTTTTRQRQNNNNTYFATPRKSLSENVQRNRYHYDINNNTTTNTQYNNNINTIKTKIKMITSSIPSPRTNKSTSSIPARRFQSTLNDPPLCFCNELANERKTSHEGIIYECHWLQNNIDDKQQVSSPTTTTTTPVTKERLLCAFHVHKEFWNTCRQNLREKKSIDKLDASLASCPEFNLTFSIVLPQQRNNTFTKRIPYTPPNCFCNRPARLFDDPNRYHKERPFFACKQLDGSDPPIRCGFFLSIENARFKPTEREGLELPIPVSSPTTSFSSTSDHSTCSRQQKHRRNQYQPYNNNNPDWPPSPHGSVCSIATTTSFRINPDEDETIYNSQQQPQSSDPLDTLLKTSTNRKSMNHLPFIKTNEENESILSNNNNHYNNEEELKGENINNYNTRATNNAHFIQLLRGAKISPFLRTLSSKDNNEDNNNLLSFIMQGNNDLATPTTTTTPKMNYSYNGASNYGSLIPSAVYARYAINKKTVMDNQLLSDEHKIQQQIQELEEIIFQLKQENDQQRQMNIIKQKEVSKLQIEQKEQRTKSKLLIQQAEQLLIEKEELVDHMDEIRHILKEEMEIRQKSQIRQNELEVMTEEVLNMNQILNHEIEDKEDKLNMKDLKCRVCFQENIEFALVPCYHCSYCRTCAEKLTECAICREAKYAIQKVYLS